MITRDVLVYDTETDSLDTTKAKVKFFGAYSYLTDEFYLLSYKDKEKICQLIQKHRVFVSFNGKEFDNPILENNGYTMQGKVFVDLYEISAQRGSGGMGKNNKNKLIQMGVDIKKFSLKNIIQVLKLDENSKGDIDYKIFQKDDWTEEELKEIFTYLKQDIVLTKKLFEWYEEQFKPLKPMLSEYSQKNYRHLTSTLSSLAYEIICNKSGLKADYGERGENRGKSYAGAHHINPRWDKIQGNIVNVDFACLHKNTEVITQNGNKKISDLQIGDKIRGVDKFENIVNINKKKIDKLYKIVLETGEIIFATAEHKFPIKYIGDKRSNELKIGDEMINYKNNIRMKGLRLHKKCVICGKDFLVRKSNYNSYSTCSKECFLKNKQGNKNGNFKNALQEIRCPVCNKIFKKFISERAITCGNKKCFNFLRSKNNKRYFLGKKKENTPQLMKVSMLKKGVKRTEGVINKIKNARAKQKRTHTSKIEIKIQNFLEQLGIEYYKHKFMNIKHHYQCDIFIPSINLVIECDGDYWHKYPYGTTIDNIRTKELIENGFKILRLWERKIKNLTLNEFENEIQKITN